MENSTAKSYDFVIIGAGAAGLHLALAMASDSWFSNKQVLLLDADSKQQNDRTWCFWEEGVGKWDAIAAQIWKSGEVQTTSRTIPLVMGGYSYKMVRGLDFYTHARNVLSTHPGIHWKTKQVSSVTDARPALVSCTDGSVFQANHVFDSRLPSAYTSNKFNGPEVKQHFLGWFVQTEQDVFNQHTFTMMDFRVTYKSTTCFTYVLPTSPRTALVEFTLFTPDLISQAEYEECLQRYFSDILHCKRFSILEKEYGVIPMTSFPFHLYHGQHTSLIGTAGGWVKPSTGYSFKNAERYALEVLSNLKNVKLPHQGVAIGRHRKYDLLLLDIFQRANHLGNAIFERMYRKNNAAAIFIFLDGKSSLLEDIRIISSLQYTPFIKSMVRHFKSFWT